MGNEESTNPERFQQVKAVFLAALEVDPEERRDFVRGRCAETPEIQKEVLELLGLIDEFPPGFIEPPYESMGPPPLEGKEFDGFRIEREIGRGAMGVVYEATQLELDRRCAIKVLPHNYRKNSSAIQRFRREAKAVSRLDHENIVQVYTSGESEGIFYYAMELIEGESLAEHIERQRNGQPGTLDLQDPDCCAALVEGIARALEHAHEKFIIHRDIKPANILIDQSGAPRVVDFGLAKDERLESLSAVGMVVGTPYYMSPEQALPQTTRVDARSDIYSLGAVLYELLTLAHPHEGESSLEIFYKIAHDRPRPVQSLRADVPRDLARICMTALERDPDHRIQSAGDLADRIADFRAQRTVILPRKPWRDRLREATKSRFATPLAITAVIAVLTTGAVSLFARNTHAATWTAWTIRVGDGTDARVRSRPIAVGGQMGTWKEHGSTRSGQLTLRFAPGSHLVRLEGGERGFCELRQECTGSALRSTAWLRTDTEASPGMVEVPAGSFALEFKQALGEPATTCQVDVARFRIDQRPVTIREFLAFLRATAPDQVAKWSPFKKMKDGLPRPDYLDLPAVGLTIDQARSYAAWRGKRLPTLAEWQRAVGGREPDWWKALVDSGDVQRLFICDQPATQRNKEGEISSGVAFLRFAQPVRTGDPVYGPHRIQQPFGNVSEWTSTPARAQGRFVIVGYAWHVDHGFIKHALLAKTLRTEYPSYDLGFRCVRSAE